VTDEACSADGTRNRKRGKKPAGPQIQQRGLSTINARLDKASSAKPGSTEINKKGG
jgi:hypothetical protein